MRPSDAARFFEILSSPNYVYFDVRPTTIEDEKKFIKKTWKKSEQAKALHFAITVDGKLVGGCGIKIDQHRKHIGEIGYFIDDKHWNQGIATQAVKQLERICFERLGMTRIHILMNPNNKASERVAIKCGYEKEGHMKKALLLRGEYVDCYMYAKTI
jgi:ribosomal-protein-alanine N-acetyltransferase